MKKRKKTNNERTQMSDDKITLPKRIVQRSGSDDLYYVCTMQDGYWEAISKGYPHSTSAYANLGRQVQKDTLGLARRSAVN